MTDCMLYLDSHPDDQTAIEYYSEIKDKYREAMQQYSKRFGDVTDPESADENYLDWMSVPFPWEENTSVDNTSEDNNE